MNTCHLFKPHPLLHPLIQMVMVKGVEPWEDASKKVYTYPPTPIHCIIIYLGSPIRARKMYQDTFERQSRCVVVGPQLTTVDIELSKDHRAVMIGFQPGGLYRFLGIPMSEMFDDGIDGFDILDKEITCLIDELRETVQPEQINAKVQMFLLNKSDDFHERLPFDRAVRQLIQPGNSNTCTMDDVARDACLSLRQFQRKCHERLGMTPKLYARIARFSRAYNMFEANQKLTWSHITHRCGYFDQMHFLRDFKEFAGVTPGLMSKKLEESNLSFQAPMKIG
jgi:AraC-like DNA-binding protein